MQVLQSSPMFVPADSWSERSCRTSEDKFSPHLIRGRITCEMTGSEPSNDMCSNSSSFYSFTSCFLSCNSYSRHVFLQAVDQQEAQLPERSLLSPSVSYEHLQERNISRSLENRKPFFPWNRDEKLRCEWIKQQDSDRTIVSKRKIHLSLSSVIAENRVIKQCNCWK